MTVLNERNLPAGEGGETRRLVVSQAQQAIAQSFDEEGNTVWDTTLGFDEEVILDPHPFALEWCGHILDLALGQTMSPVQREQLEAIRNSVSHWTMTRKEA